MKLHQSLSLGLMFALGLTASATAKASDNSAANYSSPTMSSASQMLQTLKKNAKSYYLLEVAGPTIKSLSGNSEGNEVSVGGTQYGGTNLTFIHYLAAGMKLGSKWTVMVSQSAAQYVDEVPVGTRDSFVMNDPYITFSNSRILAVPQAKFALNGYVRYYAPLSRLSNQRIDSAAPNEAGRGTVRLTLNPNFSWLDGALALNFYNLFHYRFSAVSNPERTAKNGGSASRADYYHIFDPILSYSINSKVDVYLEYAAYMRHNSRPNAEGKQWSRLDSEHSLSPGLYISAAKGLFLNPYISWGGEPSLSRIGKSTIGLAAQYTFL